MRFGSRWQRRPTEGKRGQMVVELAVCLPIILAVLGVALNVLGYLNVCARFDRVAAESVRTQAASAGYLLTSVTAQAQMTEEMIRDICQRSADDALTGFDCEYEVTARDIGWDLGTDDNAGGLSISMLSSLRRFDCTVYYRPWPLSRIAFLQFVELEHTRSYTVDQFRPGVLF